MIYTEYVEFDMPDGEQVRRLEAYGHAGFAPKGQDIVCAAASMLMETLVYQLAGSEEAECCAYNEPTGPRVSVRLKGSLDPADLNAMEFAKTGFSLLAEKYPANVRFEDKSRDGQEKMVDLQLFAATATTAASGGNREELLGPRPAGCKQSEADAGSRNPFGGLNLQIFADDGGAPSQSAADGNETSQALRASSPDRKDSLRPEGDVANSDRGRTTIGRTGNSALDEEGSAGRESDSSATEENDSADEKGEEKKLTPAQRRKAFAQMMTGEYQDLFAERDAAMAREIEQRLTASPEMQELFRALNEKYGTDAADLKALTEAVRNGVVKDDAYFEQLAMEKGVSVKTAREMDKLESENKRLTAREAMAQQMQQEAARQARITAIHEQWDREAADLSQKYPGFDKDEVLANPEVSNMMRAGISMENAYRAAYFDRLMAQQTEATAKQVENGVMNREEQRRRRPGENGTRPGGAVQTKIDVEHMSRKEREALEKRVLRGEIITL